MAIIDGFVVGVMSDISHQIARQCRFDLLSGQQRESRADLAFRSVGQSGAARSGVSVTCSGLFFELLALAAIDQGPELRRIVFLSPPFIRGGDVLQ